MAETPEQVLEGWTRVGQVDWGVARLVEALREAIRQRDEAIDMVKELSAAETREYERAKAALAERDRYRAALEQAHMCSTSQCVRCKAICEALQQSEGT